MARQVSSSVYPLSGDMEMDTGTAPCGSEELCDCGPSPIRSCRIASNEAGSGFVLPGTGWGLLTPELGMERGLLLLAMLFGLE